jgi:hypothetical protein
MIENDEQKVMENGMVIKKSYTVGGGVELPPMTPDVFGEGEFLPSLKKIKRNKRTTSQKQQGDHTTREGQPIKRREDDINRENKEDEHVKEK